MKIDGSIYLIKGEEQTATSTPSPASRKSPGTAAEKSDTIRLVQTENRRAMLADPESLAEAKVLVAQLVDTMKKKDEDQLGKVHRLDPHLLFRLV